MTSTFDETLNSAKEIVKDTTTFPSQYQKATLQKLDAINSNLSEKRKDFMMSRIAENDGFFSKAELLAMAALSAAVSRVEPPAVEGHINQTVSTYKVKTKHARSLEDAFEAIAPQADKPRDASHANGIVRNGSSTISR
jgi:hypothetical protein